MNIVATSQITIVDLNDSVFVPNLLPWSKDWVAGSGSLERWTAHGDAAENVRSLFLDPFGYKNILWRCIPDADGGASGGFTIGGIRLNREKTYRFTCFIKRSSTIGGTLTIGMGNVNTLAGVSVSNAPLISFLTAPQADRWYLLVGILHPAGTTSSIGKTGIYDMRGTKLTEGVEYAFGVTPEPTFYVKLDGATTVPSEVQLFMPTLECLDGTEESIQTLIRYDGSENDYLRANIEWDADNNAIKVNGNFYTTGSNSALGVGTGGGGGSSYNMVSDWSQYVAGSELWVVSAELINSLRTSVTSHIGDSTHASAGEKSNWNAAYSHSLVTGGVHMTSTDRSQLTTAYNHSQAAHDYAPSSHVGATGSAHGVATTSVAGFMSTTDKSKLDGIEAQANKYIHPTKTSQSVGGGAHFITAFTSDTLGHVTGITTAAMAKADVEAVLVGNTITSHYHDDRYFQKGELFTKEGSGTEADPYRIKANFPFYGVSSVAALGIGVGGGGTAYDRLDTWASYDITKAGWVLSAALGYDLHDRVSTLESSTPNIAWGVAGSGYIPLAVNGVSHQLSTYGHTHTKSSITDFAHTHDDRYYTEAEVNTLLTNKSNWDTAYGWGNHASAGYALNSALTTHAGLTNNPHAVTKTQVGLSNVENTALSTWAGSGNITALGTVTTGTWSANTIAVTKGGTGKTSVAANSMLYATAADAYGEVATTAFGRGLLSAASGTFVSGLNADLIDNFHIYDGHISKYAKNLTFSTVNTTWYLLISMAAYSRPNKLHIYSIYNNRITNATIELSGFELGYIYRDSHQNGGNIAGIWYETVRLDATTPHFRLWLKMSPILDESTGYYRPDSYATVSVKCDTVDMNLSAQTENPGGVFDSGSSIIIKNATLYGNATTATKLATSRTIFGQSFDGTANVTGAMSATTAILSNLTANKIPYHTATGLTDSPIVVSGNDVSTAGNLTLSSADGSYLQVGGGRLVWDNTNNAIKVIKADGKAANFYATGSNTALGIGTGGGGSSYNMVSNWSQYVAGSELWVVSAELINALRTRVTALEEDTPNVAWGVATTDYVPLTVNAVSRQLSVYGHGHTFASLASKPTTLAGYGITDAMSTSHAANGITSTNISNWSTAYGWGNHASAGYALNSALTSHTGNTSNPHGVTIAQIGAASGSFAYYQFTGATQYSWVRIARLTQDSAYGVISISNNYYNNPPSPVTFSFGVTHRSTQNSFITQIGGSNLHISKARILIPTSFDGDYYLEIYTTSPVPYNNGYYISLANSLFTVLYTVYTAGSIPSGYAAREITFRSNGVVSDYFVGALEGNAATATKLETTRALTIGNTAKNFDGSAAVSWSLAEIGAMSASATTDSVNEGTTNYYFTASRVLGVNLSSVTPSNIALAANIHISTAMNRIQGQINARALLAGASTQDFATKNLSVTGTVTATDAIKGSKLYSGFNYTNQTGGFGFGIDGLHNGALFYTGADTSGRIYRDGDVMYFVRGISATGGFSMNSVGAVTFNQAVETKALLTATGNIATANVDGAYMQIGPIKILYDATNGAIRVEGNIYATGSNTAFGIGGGAGGGGLITNVYGSAGFGGSYSDVDLSSTFNAYAINSLYTALQGKQNTITGAISTLVSSNLYPNYALVSGATGKIHASGVTATELSYLSGVTSAVQYQIGSLQTQINAKPSINSYPTAFSWSAGSTSGPTGTLSGSNMTAVSFSAIPEASFTASGVVTTGSQTFSGAKTFTNGIKISSEMAVELLGGAPYLYSNEQGEAIMTFDNGQIKVTHHWESIFEGAVSTGALTASTVSTGALTASTISTGDVAFKVQKLTRQLSPSDISAGMYQFSGAHANPSKVVFMGCQVYQASNGSLYGDTLSGDGEYFLHPVAAYNNNINVYFESADNSLSADDTLVLFLIYTL